MTEDALMTGYFETLDQAMYLFDLGVIDDSVLEAGQDNVPFFLPEEFLLYQGMELPPELQGQKFILDPEILLPNDDFVNVVIPSEIKEVVSFLTLAVSTYLVPELVIPVAIAGSFAGVAHILRAYSEPESLGNQIADFMLKVNKVIFFCTAAIALGRGLTDAMGPSPITTILSSGMASMLNPAYNILEEWGEYSFLPPPPGKFPTTGVDKHSCVNYETGDVMLGYMFPKVVNKMAGRTAKQTTKELLNSLLDETLLNNALFGLPVSFFANFSSNVMETLLNSGTKDLEHHLQRDFIGAAVKTLSKEGIERLSIEMLGGTNDYASTSVSIFLSVLARTFYDGYWDAYLPGSVLDSPSHEYINDPNSEIEDFDNDS
ncbi:MAG: hypothetical protein JSS50_05295 [Proteobacteria bacterium]|nr:hypothetical protein [Pseudomonadota bacterium]